jgi:RNA polymerase sigma factor (sigma-70 family)
MQRKKEIAAMHPRGAVTRIPCTRSRISPAGCARRALQRARTVKDEAAAAFDYAAAIERCAAGDRNSLRALYDRDAAAMIGVARRILRRRDLAEEAVHDAFVQVWHRADSFDRLRGSGRSWLFAIVRNRALTILRDGAREDLTDRPALEEEPDLEPSPEAIVAGLSDASRLRRCLEALEPSRRAGIVMAYTHGLSHGEIAARLAVPLGTAKSWIRRAFASLRACMQ